MPIPQPSTDPDQPDRQQAENTQYYLNVLHELIDMGAELARATHRRGMAEATAADDTVLASEPVPDATVAFDRITRTIRRTIALARHVAEPLPERAARRDAGHDAAEAAQRRAAARKQIIRRVENEIHSKARSSDEAESLRAELMERLDGPDLDDWSADWGRPVEAIIADIEADLGLANHPGMRAQKRRTPADIAMLCARAAGPGAPPRLAGVARDPPPDTWMGGDLLAAWSDADIRTLRHAARPPDP